MKKIIISLITFILAIVSVIFIYNSESTKEPVQNQEENITQEQQDLSILSLVKEDSASQITNLVAVDGSNSLGIAYRLTKDGKLYHAVQASMSNPTEGSVYEGWLVQLSPFVFFSTGVMEKNKEGYWILEYEAQEEFSSYIRVVITEETVVDAASEKHIIEGDFIATGWSAYTEDELMETYDKDFKDKPVYFEGIVGDYLIIDIGTGPAPRGLVVYDLSNKKTVLEDSYSNPLDIKDNEITYWAPTDLEVTAENCPESVEWAKGGLGAGMEKYVSFDLITLAKKDLGQTRCSARQ